MLVLTRRIGEEIRLPSHGVTITVVSVAGSRVKLGVTAPADVPVHRKEKIGLNLEIDRPVVSAGRVQPK
ncbi:MAG: carbon storage regulator [Rhodopirellula sp.]|nr:carbon storage regulator [Rhodopirellula sp.]